MGSFGWKSTDVTVPLCPGSCIYASKVKHLHSEKSHEIQQTLYSTRPLSTSQIHTIRSAPPTAARRPSSSLLQAPFNSVFSNPAGAPWRMRWTRAGEGEKGRTSWMMVCEESEGERRYDPFGESASEVGVSVCPVSVYTSWFFRTSYTCRIVVQRVCWGGGLFRPGQRKDKERANERERVRTWISLSNAATYTF